MPASRRRTNRFTIVERSAASPARSPQTTPTETAAAVPTSLLIASCPTRRGRQPDTQPIRGVTALVAARQPLQRPTEQKVVASDAASPATVTRLPRLGDEDGEAQLRVV